MDRRIKNVKRDKAGKITALCNPGKSWSPRSVADVIKDINANEWSYYVQELGRRSYLRLISSELQTKVDAASPNHLRNLPSA